MKFEILNRFSGEVQITAEIECAVDTIPSVKLGLAVMWAVKEKANLRSANLYGADLRSANLGSADLRSANLRSADLYGADLRSADLGGADLGSADLRSANLRSANLYGANLYGANLYGADLRSADLRSANLRSANLYGANLYGANLRSADLGSADLRSANLRSANLYGADLYGADLRSADLGSADLYGANLYGANLYGADLRSADLGEAKNAELPIAQTRILPEGSLIGWKKCSGGVIVKLRIPEEAKRSHAFGRKCRAEFADVIEIIGGDDVAVSRHDYKTEYRVGQRVMPDSFDENWMEECAAGIHFFITSIEAENY